MKNLTFSFLLLLLAAMVFTSCKKDNFPKNNVPDEPNVTYAVYSQNSAGLIASAAKNENGGTVYYYGIGSGSTADIQSVVYKNPVGDSLYYFKLDAQKRIAYIYVKYSDGTIHPVLYSYSYPYSDTTIFSIHSYDWITGVKELKFKAKVYQENGEYVNQILYGKKGGTASGVCSGMSAVAQAFDMALGSTLSLSAGIGAVALGLGPVTAAISVIGAATIYFSNDLCAAEPPVEQLPDDVPPNPEEEEDPNTDTEEENPNPEDDDETDPTDPDDEEISYSLIGSWNCTEWLVGGQSKFGKHPTPLIPCTDDSLGTPMPFNDHKVINQMQWTFTNTTYSSYQSGTEWSGNYYPLDNHCVTGVSSQAYNETEVYSYTSDQHIFITDEFFGNTQFSFQWLSENKFRITSIPNNNAQLTFVR